MITDHEILFDRLSTYFLSILLSTVVFGALFATYEVVSFEDSWGFGPTFFISILYSFPFFAFAALPISLLVDYSKIFRPYSFWTKSFIYAGFGGLTGLIGSLILYDIFPIITVFLFGLSGGFIHFYVLAALKKIIK